MESLLDKFYILMGLDISYMPKEYNEAIFHYTSPSGFNSILFGAMEKLTLWASRYDCLNDMSEGTIAVSVYKEVCEEMKKHHELTEEMYNLVFKVPPARTILIPHTVEGNIKMTRPECDRFICSFSQNRDSLAMWNYYSKGNKYEGYNIGFLPSMLKESLEKMFYDKEIAVHIYPIVYKKDEQKALIKKLLLRLQELYKKEQETSIRYVISNQLLEWSLIFKSEYFQHEEEVRIVVDVARRIKNGMLEKRPIDIKYRNSYGFVIPYIELQLDKNVLRNVCVGPLQCDDKQKELQQEIVKELLASNCYTAVETSYSKIPVRY